MKMNIPNWYRFAGCLAATWVAIVYLFGKMPVGIFLPMFALALVLVATDDDALALNDPEASVEARNA